MREDHDESNLKSEKIMLHLLRWDGLKRMALDSIVEVCETMISARGKWNAQMKLKYAQSVLTKETKDVISRDVYHYSTKIFQIKINYLCLAYKTSRSV